MIKLFSKFVLLVFLLINANGTVAQVGIGTNNPSASAQLEVSSSSKGFLPPRIALSGTNDNSTIVSPTAGLLIYNTSSSGSGSSSVTPGYYYYNGSAWQRIMNSSGSIIKKTILFNQSATTTAITGQNTVTNWSGTYSASGGTVELRANFSAYTSGSAQAYYFSLLRDGVVVDNTTYYFNQSGVHQTIPELSAIIANESGNHTYAIRIGTGVTVDTYDIGKLVVTEYKLD